jgi:hypothetical protein
MAGPWELICDHAYSGTPGVIFDRSPVAASHGNAISLDAIDFLADGATAGSGAIRFDKPRSRVHVPTGAPPWRALAGVRAEVTLRSSFAARGVYLHSDSFGFFYNASTLNAWGYTHMQISSQLDAVGSPWVPPAGKWMTLGFAHDGLSTMELYADGEVIARQQAVYSPLRAPDTPGLSIGNLHDGSAPAHAEIDAVRIWRLNPRRVEEEFFGRPMDAATADCWKRFLEQLRDAVRRHPDCAAKLAGLTHDAVVGQVRQILAKGPDGRARLEAASLEYRKLWRKGRIDGPEMRKVFDEFREWLRSVGLDPQASPALAALINSKCYQVILAEISPPLCDPKLVAMLKSLA